MKHTDEPRIAPSPPKTHVWGTPGAVVWFGICGLTLKDWGLEDEDAVKSSKK